MHLIFLTMVYFHKIMHATGLIMVIDPKASWQIIHILLHCLKKNENPQVNEQTCNLQLHDSVFLMACWIKQTVHGIPSRKENANCLNPFAIYKLPLP